MSEPVSEMELILALDRAQQALVDEIAVLREGLEQLAVRAGAGDAVPCLRWFDMDPNDADAQQAQMTELIHWVAWLTSVFPIDADLPECWPAHSALVEELTALFSAHGYAYRQGAVPEEGLRWHEALFAARGRWRAWNVDRCNHSQHRPSWQRS